MKQFTTSALQPGETTDPTERKLRKGEDKKGRHFKLTKVVPDALVDQGQPQDWMVNAPVGGGGDGGAGV